jgi:hypothetical protein
MTGVVPTVLALPVAAVLVPSVVVLGAVALSHAECVRLVADDDQTAILLSAKTTTVRGRQTDDQGVKSALIKGKVAEKHQRKSRK